MPDQSESPKNEADIPIRQAEGFQFWYANNVMFDTTIWDLRMVFGELARGEMQQAILQQHTSVTISWLQAKIMAFFLLANLRNHETAHGPIRIPKIVQPQVISDEEAKMPIIEMLESVFSRIAGEEE